MWAYQIPHLVRIDRLLHSIFYYLPLERADNYGMIMYAQIHLELVTNKSLSSPLSMCRVLVGVTS